MAEARWRSLRTGDLGGLAAPDEPLSRESRHFRRKRAVRAKTIQIHRLPKRELELGRLLYPDADDVAQERPRTRGECAGGSRPCPFVSCIHHLYLDVHPKTGNLKLNFPDLEPEQLADSCSLDVADRGGITLEQAGEVMNLTRERIRQLEVTAMAHAAAARQARVLRDYVEGGRRRLPVLSSG